ncbi:hypothetical protein [Pleomorphomonas oryzae]|uniref:hypothetical protein n=1 Tax=Pleomorphomonas oryzae TaxID=261934 RepID=UPI0003FBD8C3|nr:hypothetical protein [Pleomorphomonas oryzae]
MGQTSTITDSQGAALLWLRKVGGRASTNGQGYVATGKEVCPVLLAAFSYLAKRGLVMLETQTAGAIPVYAVTITAAGRTHTITTASERRLYDLQKRSFGHA